MTIGAVASARTVTVVTTAPTLGNTQISDGTTAITKPTGSGGLLVYTICLFSCPAPTSATVTPPAANVIAWTLRSYKGNTTVASWVFTKPAEAGDGATFTYTVSGSTAYQANSMSRVTHAGGTPTVDAVGTPLETTTTTPQFPALTTVTGQCLLLAYGSSGTATWSSPGDSYASVNAWIAQALYQRNSGAAGTYGPTSVTLSGSVINDTHTIALAGF
jgi:hypothetical protein